MENETNLVKHAKREFENLGWPGEDDMQEAICNDVLELLNVFSRQGHSGSSAPYCLSLFEKLARFNPISPLTGSDDEWEEVGNNLFQNKRDSEVFKENGEAYWIGGKIFNDGECSFTSIDSRVPVKFPWRKPKPKIVKLKK